MSLIGLMKCATLWVWKLWTGLKRMFVVMCLQRGKATPGHISSFLAFGTYGLVGIKGCFNPLKHLRASLKLWRQWSMSFGFVFGIMQVPGQLLLLLLVG